MSSPVATVRYAHPQAVLSVVCLIGLIAVAGIALPYPILAPLFAASVPDDFNHWYGIAPQILLGVALAANPLGMLFGSATLGALSDHYGRRRVLALALTLAIAGYLGSAWALSAQWYPGFVLFRFLTGLCEGAVSICRAIAADLHPQIERTVAISWMNSALYGAWLVGPLLGGLTMHLGVEVPFLIAAAAMLPCLLLLYFLLPADQPVAGRQAFWQQLQQHNSLRLVRAPALQLVVAAQLLYTIGLNAFYEYYPLWLVEQQQFSGLQIGVITAALCAVMTTVSAVGMARYGSRFPALRSARYAAVVLALMLWILPWTGGALAWVWLVLCGVPNAMFSAWFQVYCTEQFGALGLGRVMGLLTLLMCCGNVIIALAGGVIALLGASWILWTGAVFVALAAVLLRREERAQASGGSAAA